MENRTRHTNFGGSSCFKPGSRNGCKGRAQRVPRLMTMNSISDGLANPMKVPNRSDQGLWTGFLRSAGRFPGHSAVVVEGKTLSYGQLRELACRIAAPIQLRTEDSSTPLTGVFGYPRTVAISRLLGFC